MSLIASEYERAAMTPDDIVEAHPHLTLADVHAALSFFYERQESIHREWRDDATLIDQLRKRHQKRAPVS